MIFVLQGLFWLLQSYFIFIVINIFLTWIPFVYKYNFFRVCRKISDWYLGPFRGIIVLGMFDFSPIIGLFIFQFILQAMQFMIFF